MGKNYIIDSSFQMVRTNPLLTTNLQIVVGSDYNLYLESINSHKYLSDDKYKHFSISKESFLEDKIPVFYDGLPINIAFCVKDDNDEDIVYDRYEQQFDTLYWSGVSKTKENDFYKEEYEYFAPLYVNPDDMPGGFVILRVDDPAIYKISENDKIVHKTNKENFRSEIIEKWKCVNFYDMTRTTSFGFWLDRNYINNSRFPKSPFEFDSKKYNFSRWYGINYFTGVYTSNSLYMEDKLRYENPHFRMEKFITENFKNNELIYPNIANFKFLFDDTPGSPFELKKYSLNRYFGFYVDLELVETLTPYKGTTLKDGLKIENNIFMKENQITGSTMPFKILRWDTRKNYYVFAQNDLYRVDRVLDNGVYYYKIISDIDLTIDDVTRDNEVDIVFNDLGNGEYNNYIKPRNKLTLFLDELITQEGVQDLYGDLYLIKIDNKYHVLECSINDYDGRLEHFIRTDYGVECNYKELTYWLENKTRGITETVDVEDILNDERPIKFDIYRVKFREVKDFDFHRVDTGYADFDFQNDDEYEETSEHKLYATEHRDASDSLVFKRYDKKSINFEKIVNVSSEYVSTDELFEINKNGLSDIWRKNQSHVKWGYKNSISHSDYPYKFNNSNKVGFSFNRTTDTFNRMPDVISKTHDYFYRVGDFYKTDYTITDTYFAELKTTKQYYDNQTVSIETEMLNEPYFNLDRYIESDIDYFYYFFKNNRYRNKDTELTSCESKGSVGDYEQYTHYSIINNGDKYTPSTTLFKGIKYNFNWLKNLVRNETTGDVETLIFDKEKDLNGYKFSVILNAEYVNSALTYNPCDEYLPQMDELQEQITTLENEISDIDNEILELSAALQEESSQRDKSKGESYTISTGEIERGLKYLNGSKSNKEREIEELQLEFSELSDSYTNCNIERDEQLSEIESVLGYEPETLKFNSDVPISLSSVYTERTDIFDKDGIHIFMNDKYKNILIIIHKKLDAKNKLALSLNNLSAFDGREGLYYNKYLNTGTTSMYDWGTEAYNQYNPGQLNASNFIMAMNFQNTLYFNQYNKYYYINEDKDFSYTYIKQSGNTLRNPTTSANQFLKMNKWKKDFTPFVVSCELPDKINIKKKSYITAAIKGPKYNIYDKYKTDYTETVYNKSFIKEPLSRYIYLNEKEPEIRPQLTKELIFDNIVFRYNGPYEPIFKDVELYKPTEYYSLPNGFFEQKRCGGKLTQSDKYTIAAPIYSSERLEISILNTKINEQKLIIEYIDDKLTQISKEKNQIDYISDSTKQDKLVVEQTFYENLKSKKQELLNQYTIEKDAITSNDSQDTYRSLYEKSLDEYSTKVEKSSFINDESQISEIRKQITDLDSNVYSTKSEEISQLNIETDITPKWDFNERILSTCDGSYGTCDLILENSATTNQYYRESNSLSIYDFDFEIPLGSNISGIKVELRRRAALGKGDNTINTSCIIDNTLKFKRIDGTYSDDYANKYTSSSIGYDYSDIKNFSGVWSIINESVVYGGENDLWGFDELSAEDVNSEDFSLSFSLIAYRPATQPTVVNIAYLDCACVTLYYTIPDISTGQTYLTQISKNTVFDTELSTFGEIDELIYSKVNEKDNPLKIKSTEEDISIYTMVDEFGLSYDRRFIFKSSWDIDYYIRTKNELDE